MQKDPSSGVNPESQPRLPKIEDDTAKIIRDLELVRTGRLASSDPIRAVSLLSQVGEMRANGMWALYQLKDIVEDVKQPSPVRGEALLAAAKIDPKNEELIELIWRSMTQLDRPYLKAFSLLAAHEVYPTAVFARPIESLYQLGRTILSPVLCPILLRDDLKLKGITPPSVTPTALSLEYPPGFEKKGYQELLRVIRSTSSPSVDVCKALIELARRYGDATESRFTCLTVAESLRGDDIVIRAHAITALGMIKRGALLPSAIQSPEFLARLMLSPKSLHAVVKASFDLYLRY